MPCNTWASNCAEGVAVDPGLMAGVDDQGILIFTALKDSCVVVSSIQLSGKWLYNIGFDLATHSLILKLEHCKTISDACSDEMGVKAYHMRPRWAW